MGYSVGIYAQPRLHRKMTKFLQKHYNPNLLVQRQSSGDPSDVLDYSKKKYSVGFDYASGLNGWERIYVFAVVHWMGLKAAQRKKKFSKDAVEPNKFDEAVPFMVYDGYEHWPLLVCESKRDRAKLPKSLWWCAVDEVGCYFDDNESVVNAAIEDAIFQEPGWFAGYRTDMEKLGEKKLYETDFERWREEHQKIKLKHTQSAVRVALRKIRAELRRLDGLWSS